MLGRVVLGLTAAQVAVATLNVVGNGRDLVEGALYPSGIDNTKFGIVCPGTSKTQTFNIENNGATAIEVSGITVSFFAAGNPSTYEVPNWNSGSIAAGDNQDFEIEFDANPTATTGYNRAQVDIEVGGSAEYTFGISARTELPNVEVQLLSSPNRPLDVLDFGDFVEVPASVDPLSLKLTNLAKCDAVIEDVYISYSLRDDTTDFSFVSDAETDFSSTKTIGFQENYAFDVEFEPFAEGMYTGGMTVTVENGLNYHFEITADVGADTASPTAEPTPYTFDWGSDCVAGSGEFNSTLAVKKSYSNVGDVIPVGKYDVLINLEAADDKDLDIWLFDMDADADTYPEGQAIVRYCTAKQLEDSAIDCGLIGQEDSVESVEHYRMNIEYSGWFEGSEYIKITGMTTRNLQMKSYAYEVGTAEVKYSWSASCAGTPFTNSITKNDKQLVGTIPAGTQDVNIYLKSDNGEDIDIQLYDLSDTSTFSEGAAIVAYCKTPSTCNYGPFTDDDPITGTTVGGIPVAYSGWNGMDGDQGYEYISLTGTTTVDMDVYAYGYKAGTATVEYWWTN